MHACNWGGGDVRGRTDGCAHLCCMHGCLLAWQVGTLGTAGFLDVIAHLRALATAAGKKTYTFLMGKPNPAKLGNFPEVRMWEEVRWEDVGGEEVGCEEVGGEKVGGRASWAAHPTCGVQPAVHMHIATAAGHRRRGGRGIAACSAAGRGGEGEGP